jgi:serine phosphatase RsbU (regulator of sigma subunit)
MAFRRTCSQAAVYDPSGARGCAERVVVRAPADVAPSEDMTPAAKGFAWKVLSIHVMLLLLAIGSVLVAAREMYLQARDQAMEQSRERQKLLAAQTARGIESHYQSILANLDLIGRGDRELDNSFLRLPHTRVPLLIAPMLWHQLEGRVSHLFALDPALRVQTYHPPDRQQEAQEIVDQARLWLLQVREPGIGPLLQTQAGWAHLLCVPMAARSARGQQPLLVAVVPIRSIEMRLLDPLSRGRSVQAMLLEEHGRVLATAGSSEAAPWGVGQIAFPNGPPEEQGLVTREGISVAGAHWVLWMQSDVAEVDAILAKVFRHAVFWALLVVMVVTLIMISTSAQMIRSRLHVERLKGELLDKELAQARRIQLAWLPGRRSLPQGVDVAAVNEAARHISGDFYDWFELPDGRTVVTIGDVTGHGMGAAFLMATTQLLIRNTMLRVGDPGICLEDVNRQLCGQVFSGQFVTALIVVVDQVSGTMEAATAGHFPPLLGDGQTLKAVDLPSQLVLGVDEDQTWPTQEFDLPPQFTLVLYTDGAIDARSPIGLAYGEERLLTSAAQPSGSARELLDVLVRDVRQFRGSEELADDLTLVVIQSQSALVEMASA